MKDKSCQKQREFNKRRYRLVASVSLALILLLIPVTVAKVVQIPVPTISQPANGGDALSQVANRLAGNTIDVALPFGPALVYATGGLTITKTAAPDPVDQGGTLTYTITIQNDTGQDITSGSVFDPLPVEVSCSSNPAVLPPDWTFLCAEFNGDIFAVFQFTSMSQAISNGSSVNMSFAVDVSEPITDQYDLINSSYEITSTSTGASDIGVPISTKVNAPNWVINKTVSSSTIGPNGYLTYTITAINNGQLDTSGTYTITEKLPNDTALVTAPGASVNGPMLTWTFANTLTKLGGSQSVTYAVQVDSPLASGTKIVNDQYAVTGGNAVGVVKGNAVTVTVDSPVTLTISKRANPEPAAADKLFDYTLTVTNNTSTGPAQGVIISDTLPAGITYQPGSAVFLGGVNGSIDDSGNPIVWVLTDTIAPNDTVQVRLTARVNGAPLPNPPFVTNTFRASASNAPLVSGSLATELTGGDPVTLTVTPASTNLQVCGTTLLTALLVDLWNNPVRGENVVLSAIDVPPGNAEVLLPTSGDTNANGIFTATLKALNAGQARVFGFSGSINNSPLPTINMTNPPLPDEISITVTPASIDAGGETATVTAQVIDCQSNPQQGQSVSFSLSDLSLVTFSGPSGGTTDSTGYVTTTVVSTLNDELSGTVTITATSGSLVDTTSLVIGNPNGSLYVPIIMKQAQ